MGINNISTYCKNTKTVIICGEKYCYYCGKQAKHDVEYIDRDDYDYFNCDCEQAKMEIIKQKEIEDEQRRHKQKLREIEGNYENILVEFEGMKDLEYEIKLKELNKQYKK